MQKVCCGNERVCFDKPQQALCSEASWSKLAMSEGKVRSNLATAASCDNHLTSLTYFSLIAGSSSNDWIACSPDIQTGLF